MSEMVARGSKYTDDQRRGAAVLYVTKGSLSAVERETGIPRKTLSDWRASDWWETVVADVRHRKEDQFRAQLTEIIDLAHKETVDRLKNGDEVHTKDGIQRVKMRGKDAMTTAAIATDKLRLSLNLPTSITDNAGKASMQALAEQFRHLSESFREKRVKDSQAIPGEIREVSGEEPDVPGPQDFERIHGYPIDEEE